MAPATRSRCLIDLLAVCGTDDYSVGIRMATSAPTRPPTGAELLIHQIVQQSLYEAWRDSLPNDPLQRHEEGGWIYLNLTNGAILVRRAGTGGRTNLLLAHPPEIDGAIVVGTFHTHPNPSADGWDPRPSPGDVHYAALTGVPWLIRSDARDYTVGPDSRRGGLGGGPGFPP